MYVLLTLLLLLLAGYSGACWYLWAKQRELIFMPSRTVERTPAAAALRYEDVRIAVGGSAHAFLHGWWLPADDPAASAVLYLHGNDLNIGGDLDHFARIRRLGFSVLAVDYRGYGKSGGGFPAEAQVYEDADTAWNYLVSELHINPGRAFIYGHSLGGAIAIDLALRHPDAAGLIVESSFTSMPDMAKVAYWMFPADWILHQRFDAIAKVPLLRVPVLFIHGTADGEVPHEMSERLFAAAHGGKRLVLLAGGGHDDAAVAGGARYDDAVLDFARTYRRAP